MSHILRIQSDEEPEIGDPIVVEIFRFDPTTDAKPHMQQYVVPYRKRMSIFTLLREIYEHQDPTIAFRNQQCGRGICGNCRYGIERNGKKIEVIKGCTTLVNPGNRFAIFPSNQEKVIRDLVTTY